MAQTIAYRFTSATMDDFDRLAQLRLVAMRENLERVGRFEPQRNHEYFAKSFRPEYTRLIDVGGALAGCVAFGPSEDRLLLEHFYLGAAHQGAGLGTAILLDLLAEADRAQKSVRLVVLRHSPAQRLYERHGFTQTGDEDVDLFFERPPGP